MAKIDVATWVIIRITFAHLCSYLKIGHTITPGRGESKEVGEGGRLGGRGEEEGGAEVNGGKEWEEAW